MQDKEALRRPVCKTLRHQASAGAGRRQGVGEFVALDECQIDRAGKVDRCHAGNQKRHRSGLTGFGARQRNDFGHRQAWRAIEEAALSHFLILDWRARLDRKDRSAMQAAMTSSIINMYINMCEIGGGGPR
jgi:hypothetical protein